MQGQKQEHPRAPTKKWAKSGLVCVNSGLQNKPRKKKNPLAFLCGTEVSHWQ
jgi:hypothetical protein